MKNCCLSFRPLVLVLLFSFCYTAQGQVPQSIHLQFVDAAQLPIEGVYVLLESKLTEKISNNKGLVTFNKLENTTYSLTCEAEGYRFVRLNIIPTPNTTTPQTILLQRLELETQTIEVKEKGYYLDPALKGVTLLHGKTLTTIDIQKTIANLANNSARQLYQKVPGLNIWENDNSGIQLNVGGRGLNPNRTSNFNTRQNGYDISADALGYPETYYTPPAQSLQRIEVIRGAASLQFGTQFGGLLNFVLQEGNRDTKLDFITENTYGAYNFFSSFNSLGGTFAKGKANYYAFYQHKQGDGWRPNADFESNTAYVQFNYQFTPKINVKLEQTYMNYVAHQAGGLTDLEFAQNARQSKRARNWFRVNWNLSALTFDYKITNLTRLNIRTFALLASRQSLGNLEPINRVDYGNDRDLIKGYYLNIGSEARLVHRYNFLEGISTLVTGVRLYKGNTQQAQGYSNDGNTGTRADFQFSSSSNGILASDYTFPSFNFAAFAENYFAITPKFGITPGVRLEYIQTAADGYYQNLITIPSSTGTDTLQNEAIPENRNNQRVIYLGGIGISYKAQNNLEFYGNISQNYRAINFNDMRISNPNQAVDPNLQDEYGFNADLGIKGSYKGILNYKAALFYLGYHRRIGNIQGERPNAENPLIIEPYTLRTNIGNARVLGIESYIEADVWKLISKDLKSDFSLLLFANISLLDGRYTKTENSYAAGKQLEFVAPFVLRTGVQFRYKTFGVSYQYSYTARHYTDATNATWVPNAVVGEIPSYGVMDLSASYEWKWFRLQAGVNNLLNEKYFTRRATSYPGPGILPADGVSYYITLRFRLQLADKAKK